MNQVVAMVCSGLLAILGLFLASRAQDGMFGFFATLLFLFGIISIFVMVHKATGQPPADKQPGE